jgi:hypothetical protein
MLKTFGAVLLGCLLWFPGTTSAASPPIIIAEGPYEFSESEGGNEIALEVANLHSDPVQLVLLDPKDEACATEPQALAASRSGDLTFLLPATCNTEDGELTLELRASAAGLEDGVVKIDAVAASTDSTEPDLGSLDRFFVAAIVAVIVVGLAFAFGGIRNPMTVLPGIKDDWSFTDSWASSIGVAAALFTGIFGATDVLESLLGDDGTDLVTIAVVTAAIAVALIGAAPLLLVICRAGQKNQHTVLGILLASAVVLTANLGFIEVMRSVLQDSEVIDSDWLNLAAGAAAVLLVVYTLRSIPQTLKKGLIQPTEDPGQASVKAMAAQAIDASDLDQPQKDYVGGWIDLWADQYPRGTSPGDGPSAML